MHGTVTARPHRCTRVDAVCVAILIAYFLHFALPARHGGFRDDEMMNLWMYWYPGGLQSLLGLAKFWTSYYRPGGVLYYLPLYHFFGLNPFPYRIVQISILALSIPIAYYLARLLASSRLVAFLAVLAFCYHPYVANLVFVGAFIYDVLCGFFYLAALTYYVHLRDQDIRLRPVQLLIFLLLYVLALDSKEMAVTLPAIVLIYEVLKSPRWANWSAFLSWTWRCASASLIAGAVTGIYLYGKLYGSGSLTMLDPYRPRYSWHQFVAGNAKFLGELFFARDAITPKTLWIFWAAVFIYAVLRRDRSVRLMALWVIIVPLPIVFLLPIRGGGCLYLLLFGWAMIFARVACDLALLTSKAATAIGQYFRLGSAAAAVNRASPKASWRTPTERLSETSISRTPASNIAIAMVAILALSFGIFTDCQNRRLGTARALLGIGQKVRHVIAAFDSLNLRPAPHSTVLLKPDEHLFQNKWHPLFIASLVWNDRSLQIWIDRLGGVTPEQPTKIDYIISLNEFRANVERSPKILGSE
jgi:hypothetical protein